MNFNSILREHLKQNKITLAEFSRKYGISRQALNSSLKRWETNPPTIKTIKKISNILEIEPQNFLNML